MIDDQNLENLASLDNIDENSDLEEEANSQKSLNS